MVGISISPGPSRKADTTFWRDPRDGDRLVVERRLGGCALFLGAFVLFGRVRDVFERRELVVALQGDLEAYPAALGTVHTSHTT